MPNEIADYIRKLIRRERWSQEQFARMLGFRSGNGLQNYLRDDRKTYLPVKYIENAIAKLDQPGIPKYSPEELWQLAGRNTAPAPPPSAQQANGADEEPISDDSAIEQVVRFLRDEIAIPQTIELAQLVKTIYGMVRSWQAEGKPITDPELGRHLNRIISGFTRS